MLGPSISHPVKAIIGIIKVGKRQSNLVPSGSVVFAREASAPCHLHQIT